MGKVGYYSILDIVNDPGEDFVSSQSRGVETGSRYQETLNPTRYPTTMENEAGSGSLFYIFAGMGVPATCVGIPVKPDNTHYF